ncbi:MAG: DNA primase [candidate division CPR1 bacterium ADurb.Bin160]|uniref:DNA primase n=1 Tax=candidate division CPR1 bacterium ADurb.Bin160 TaxID=1852826 RepID=A0A1V5ZJG1_9BACT|nr:MAG: DNA primase [candidate division CPR1 bacterium ADurb.Bin160]
MIQLQITLEQVLNFLQDENLSNPIKIKNENSDTNWKIFINDPFISDDKFRLGISPKYFKNENKYRIIFNGFKSSALLGDDYHGDLFKFVKLVKNFNSRDYAKEWFFNKYVLRGSGLLKSKDEIIEENKIEKHEVEWDDKYEKISFTKKRHQPYIEYLLKRKITKTKIENSKIFIDRELKRIVFPVYEYGNLIFYSKRSIVPHKYRWIKSEGDEVFPIWNLDNINGEEVWLFEGIFDAMCVENGVCLFGVSFGEQIRDKILNKKFSKIVVVMDNDEAGWSAKARIAKELFELGYNVYIYNYKGIHTTYKDFNEMRINNINFDFENRIFKYDLKTEVLMKLGKVK